MKDWRLSFVIKDNSKASQIISAAILISQSTMFKPSEHIIKTLTKFRKLPLRLICAPPDNIKAAQQKVKEELCRIPVHSRAFGFVQGRSPFDCAQAHTLYWGKRDRGLTVLNIDVQDFFHSIKEAHIISALEAHKFTPEKIDNVLDVACLRIEHELAAKAIQALFKSVMRVHYDICSNVKIQNQNDSIEFAPRSQMSTINHIANVLKARLDGTIAVKRLHYALDNQDAVTEIISESLLGIHGKNGERFLPQGSPCSPVISNICMKIVDIRLTALAKSFGAFYTRYADDLSFSWPYRQSGKTVDGLKRCAILVLAEYNLLPNKKKIKVMGTGSAQDIVGYNVNSGKPTISSKYRNRLKSDIAEARLANRHTSEKEISSLMGRAGYLSLAHPAQSELFKAAIHACIDKPLYQRGMANIENHDEQQTEESGGVFIRNFSN